jgi:hypothetical protein
MRPTPPPKMVDRGIAVYVPNIDNFQQAKIEIFYSPKNPLFAWSFCDENPYKIWEKIDYQYSKGILFIYNSPTILPKGFYKIQIALLNKKGSVRTGARVYGLLNAKETLHIGLPYSAFPTIPVT